MELQQINDTIFKQSQVIITETMTINDANTEPGPAHVVTNQSMLTIDDSVTLTIDDNKVLIPDVYNINR